MKYSAEFHFPGCLSEGEPVLLDSPAEAWRYLIDTMGDAAWEPDYENDPDGPQSLRSFVLAMETKERLNHAGSVYGDGGIYCVELVADYETV